MGRKRMAQMIHRNSWRKGQRDQMMSNRNRTWSRDREHIIGAQREEEEQREAGI